MSVRRSRYAPLLVALLGGISQHGLGSEPPKGYEDIAQQMATQIQRAVRRYDTDRWSELMAEDVVMMTPGGTLLQGRDAFHNFWTRAFEGRTGPNPLEIRIDEVRASRHLIMVRARYGPEGNEAVGQYVWLLSRARDDEWRVSWWIFNRRAAPESQ